MPSKVLLKFLGKAKMVITILQVDRKQIIDFFVKQMAQLAQVIIADG
jgi:hypothetical protein